MALLDGISHLFDSFSDARRMARLYSYSDRELEALGLTRESLRQQFIAGRTLR